MAPQEPKFWIISQNPAAGGILRKNEKRRLKTMRKLLKVWQVRTRPCEVFGESHTRPFEVLGPMRLALDTHVGVGVSRKPIIMNGWVHKIFDNDPLCLESRRGALYHSLRNLRACSGLKVSPRACVSLCFLTRNRSVSAPAAAPQRPGLLIFYELTFDILYFYDLS